MRKVTEVPRLNRVPTLGTEVIQRNSSLFRSGVAQVLRRVEVAWLWWPLPEEMDDATLEAPSLT